MILQDLSDPDLRRAIRGRRAAMVPVGSLEQHGGHLPVSADSDIVTHIAGLVAKRCDLLLLPTIRYGVSFEHAPFFNASITAITLRRLLADICVSLAENGIRKIVILNGHHGNQGAIRGLEDAVRRRSRGVRVMALSYWRYMGAEFDHAGFAETSLMLACSKRVDMKRAKRGLDAGKLSPARRVRISRMAGTNFIRATGNGIWGDPRKATRRDGQRMVSEIVQNISKTVSKLA